jgi:hypothetical protein
MFCEMNAGVLDTAVVSFLALNSCHLSPGQLWLLLQQPREDRPCHLHQGENDVEAWLFQRPLMIVTVRLMMIGVTGSPIKTIEEFEVSYISISYGISFCTRSSASPTFLFHA